MYWFCAAKILSTAHVRQLKPWTLRVLHGTQHAMREGAIRAAAKAAVAAPEEERVRLCAWLLKERVGLFYLQVIFVA